MAKRGLSQRQLDARRASRLRRRVREGKPVNEADQGWLSQYDQRVTGGRPRLELVPLPPESTSSEETPAGDAAEAPAPETAPEDPSGAAEPTGAAGPAAEALPAIPALLEQPGASAAEGFGLGGLLGGGGAGLNLAKAYCDWLKRSNVELGQAGWPTLPPEAIDGVVFPAAQRFEQKALAWAAEKGASEEDLDLIAVGAPTAEILLFKVFHRKKPAETAQASPQPGPAPASSPAAAPAQQQPTPVAPAPPAVVPAAPPAEPTAQSAFAIG